MASTTATQGRELSFAGVARQAEMVRAGEVSPRELVETALGRIEALDPQLNAFRILFAERGLIEADQAGARAGAGDTRPLLGVPLAVKDDQAVAGAVRVRGSSAFSSPEPADADLVRRLRAAGAIVVGITRTPELTLWPFTETAAGGITRNPWDPQRTAGGSSGGSASAVAAGLVPGATGSDGAGSIRIPAACCGLFGLKPQRGRISTAPLDEVWNGMSAYGFLTRNVADAALLYEVATGEPYIAAAAQEPPKLRIALSLKIPPGSSARLHPDWRRAAHDTAELLRSLGHDVDEANPSIGVAGMRVVARYLAGAYDEAQTVDHPERLERRTRAMARLGKVARRRLDQIRVTELADAAKVNAIFEHFDIVLGPTLAKAPLQIGRYEGRGAAYTLSGVLRWVPFNGLWNHIGNPAAAVPAGFDSDGLPLSVQLVGRPDSERTLFSLAAQIEAARPWADQRPPIS
ncbi:MAG: amidase [Solirubrobacteraceae bacterium]|jgi:amidase|nr:amidase [Solirubrobacteraceae bacterium]MEA2189194.1 amidase [Solirubrobacteraceae bacterium]